MARGYVRRMIKRARTTAVLLVAILVPGGSITAIASTGSSSDTSPAPITTPYHPAFDAANFGGPIDNPWLPLKPGTVLRYRGVGDDGKTRERNTVRVTHRKRGIMGVQATVVLDQVFSDGKPEERTFDWYAQDKEGNVWYLGEDSRNYEKGRWVRDDGSWEAGIGNGKPGIIMLGHPTAGAAYRQEYSPGHALDQARVLGRAGPVRVPYGRFAQTLATREYSSIDHQFERKLYARGVGVIKEQALTVSKERSE